MEKALPVLSGSESDKSSIPIVKRRKGATGQSVRQCVEEEVFLSSCCESSDSGEDAVINHRVPSSRRAAATAKTKMTQQCCSCSDEDSESDVPASADESHSDREAVRPGAVSFLFWLFYLMN